MDGTLNEIRFEWPSYETHSEGNTNGEMMEELEVIGSTLLETNSVCYINGNLTDSN